MIKSPSKYPVETVCILYIQSEASQSTVTESSPGRKRRLKSGSVICSNSNGNLESVIVSQASQMEKEKYRMTALIVEPEKK